MDKYERKIKAFLVALATLSWFNIDDQLKRHRLGSLVGVVLRKGYAYRQESGNWRLHSTTTANPTKAAKEIAAKVRMRGSKAVQPKPTLPPYPRLLPQSEATTTIRAGSLEDLLQKHPEYREAYLALCPAMVPPLKPEAYAFGSFQRLDLDPFSSPVYIGCGMAPEHLKSKCLILSYNYTHEVTEHEGRTIFAFYRKPA